MKTIVTTVLQKFTLTSFIIALVIVTPIAKAQNNFFTGIAGPALDQNVTYSQPNDNITNIIVFPRPTHNVANIQAQVVTASNVTITVMDILGRVLYDRTEFLPLGAFNYQLNLSNYANGMYILEIRSGSQLVSTKLMKI